MDPEGGQMNTLYRFYANDGTLLYIGITISPPQRFKQHSRDKAWWNEVARIELVQFNSREELENEEKNAISREHPKYNITHNAAAPQAGRPDTYSRWPGGSGPCPTCRRTVIYLRNRQQYIHADDYTPWCGDGKIQPSAEEQLDAIRQGTSEAVWDMLRDRDVSFFNAGARWKTGAEQGKAVPADLPEANRREREAREQAAKAVGAKGRTVSQAKGCGGGS